VKIYIPDPTEQYIEVTIIEGDSLWGIAQKYKEEHNLTESEFVSWVKKYNGLANDTIYAGEQIIIPIDVNQIHLDNYQELASK
jgi:LysM repeat protein